VVVQFKTFFRFFSTIYRRRPIQQHGEFRCTTKAIYKLTDEGRRIAHWELAQKKLESPGTSTASLSERSSVEDPKETSVKTTDAKIHRRISMAEKLNASYEAAEKKASKESNTDRLRFILEEPSLRALFREFLKINFCEENLSFWLDVQDFKRKFNITSSAAATTATAIPPPRPSGKGSTGHVAMEKHHETLINTAFLIYNKYLAPSSQCELNIDHGLRNELAKYLDDVVTALTGKSFQGRVEPEQASAFNATQLHTMIRLYERIQTHVFRLMATDSVPKVCFLFVIHFLHIQRLFFFLSFSLQFIKTPEFLAARNWVADFDPTEQDVMLLTSSPTAPPGLSNQDEIGGAYMTVSQHASERANRENIPLS
jgi:GTPase-activating protein SST2